MYVVIMGCGRLGAQIATQLSVKDYDVVVIDEEPQAFEQLGTGFNGMTVIGTGIDLEVQKKAGVDNADVFAALTSDDNTNIMAAQVAKEIFKVPKVIARIYDPKREYVYHQLGLESICPTNVGADIVRNYIESDTLCCRVNYATVDIVEFKAGKTMAGRKVAELDKADDIRIMIVVRDEIQHVATGEWVIEEGDTLMAAMAHDYRLEFKQKWLGETDFTNRRFWGRTRR